MDWTELATHLNGIAHLAAASPTGEPHVSVVAPILEEGRLWIMTRATSGKAARLAANPRAALVWRSAKTSSEAYLYGRAELVDDLAEKRRLWTSGRLPFDPAAFFGSAENPDLVLVRITPTRAVVLTSVDGRPTVLRWQAP
ncbi:MAG: pyridoxamine 5'-phosphate oxidase family protein [Acidimicrobiales bacterium]